LTWVWISWIFVGKSMRVLSLFDGMSCLQIALSELKIPVEVYYSSEIDKHAIKQTQFNFPDTIQLGDVTKWKEWDIDWASIDFIGAGSPCQGFSFAGKQLAFDDPRSKLFFEFVAILNHIKTVNPDVKFLLENVRMKGEHEALITRFVGVNPLYINSNLVSAQNRDRIYWTNIGMVQKGLFGEFYPGIPQPEDMGIFLKDILQPESEIDEKYYISDAVIARMIRKGYSSPQVDPKKTGSINTKNNSGEMSLDAGTTFISVNGKAPTQRNATGRSLDKEHNYQIINLDGVPKSNQNKAACFTAGAHSGGNHSDMDIICVAMRGRNTSDGITEQRLEPNKTGKTNALTSVQKDNLVMQVNPSLESGGKQPYQQNRIYHTDGQFHAVMSEYRGSITDGKKYRRLTPIEVSRLQTIPEWYKWQCSDTQIYKMCGNGWTCNTIIHILSYS